MFLKKIESEGLAQYSYLVGNNGEAFVIDPRRDIQVYLDVAMDAGLKITHIFETHRNEDMISGSIELEDATGASVHISGHEDLGYVYGEKIYDGDTLKIGGLQLSALHTPGHTLGHMCYVLSDEGQDKPYMIFLGDSLFMGDIARTDFYGEENLEKMTGLLYESIFNKILPLGDHILAFPAHGNGSACGDTMDERPHTTLGYEKIHNKKLQVQSKKEFIEKFGEMRIKPRYFEVMEVHNVKGAPFVGKNFYVPALPIDEVKEDTVVLDVRSKEAFRGGYIPGSYFLSENNLSTYLGTLFDTETKIVLVLGKDDQKRIKNIHKMMLRKGFDHLVGYIKDGVNDLVSDGKTLSKIKTVQPKKLKKMDDTTTILDVRVEDDVPEALKNRTLHIPLQVLYKNLDQLHGNREYWVLCASGERATTAAAYLINKGFKAKVIESGIKGVKNADI